MIPELKSRFEDLGEELGYLGQATAGMYGLKKQPTLKKIIETAARASIYFGEELQSDDCDAVLKEIQSRRPEIKENGNPEDMNDFIDLCKRDECCRAEKILGLRYLSDKELDAAYLGSLEHESVEEQDKIFGEIKRRMELSDGDKTRYVMSKVFRKDRLKANKNTAKNKFAGMTADEYYARKWRNPSDETV